ncbi:uncharacterized protein AFUA_2G11030 [Aspergillus fumigatus Af293]|uniref:Uncharacterized protein n=2 Tax=Aspergillus fumigatus TaxID=746128 RepID=Q4X167_ASPFU|nr:hypothetical protein AFUA_2G11030 [Aspergillus fumigatus Af293]EAL93398.1 hypothetical protein AFUA_2G11030 [Aspergillus fumigatus Af293]EDP54621.1 hypothetical protein AFUB_026800 [Aspergillus fumigatus A1163]
MRRRIWLSVPNGRPQEPIFKFNGLLSSSKFPLVVGDGLDLGGRGALGVEAIGEPFVGELLGQLNADDTLAEAEDLRVVAEDGTFHGERVMSGHSADAGDLIGGDGDTQTGAADEETAVSLALLDEFGAGDGRVRIGGLVGGGVDTDVGDGLDQGVLLQGGLDDLLVGLAGLVTGHDDAERFQIGRHDDRVEARWEKQSRMGVDRETRDERRETLIYGVGPMKRIHLNDYRRGFWRLLYLCPASFCWCFYTSILGCTVLGGQQWRLSRALGGC